MLWVLPNMASSIQKSLTISHCRKMLYATIAMTLQLQSFILMVITSPQWQNDSVYYIIPNKMCFNPYSCIITIIIEITKCKLLAIIIEEMSFNEFTSILFLRICKLSNNVY